MDLPDQPRAREVTKQKILVLDDDLSIGALIAQVANTMGIPCAAAGTRKAFLEECDFETTLIVLDLLMPVTDGVEILRELSVSGCKAGIILASGVDKRLMETAANLGKMLDLQIIGQLHKPFGVAELKAMINLGIEGRPPPALADNTVTPMFDLEELRQAIHEDQLVIHYQPQIEARSRNVIGFEALVRWQHPSKGLILPDAFIGPMEEAGLITDLGWAVTRRALAEFQGFTEPGGALPTLSVNASVRSLQDLSFPDTLMNLAEEAGVPLSNIVIEITESGLMAQLPTTLDVLIRLRMKGIKLSIDDFGAGYSMMHQLRDVPANELKIDRSFVLNLFRTDRDRVMVEKTIEIGHALGMKVVAEGVESEEHLTFLAACGCDIAQGYYFSPPLAREALILWLDGFRQKRPVRS